MRKKVKFTRADGSKPSRFGDSKSFSFKAPVPIQLARGAKVRVNLGLTCSHPVQLFAARGLIERGIELDNPGVVDAGLPLVAVLSQAGSDLVTLEQGETVVRAIVLDNSEFVTEE